MPQPGAIGANVEEMDILARRFDEECGMIEQLIGRVNSQVRNTWWEGGDAQRFRAEWDGTFTNQLRNIASALRETAGQVRSQAAQQRQASA